MRFAPITTLATLLGAISLAQGFMCDAKVYPSDYCCDVNCQNDAFCCVQCDWSGGGGSCWSEWNDGTTRNYHCDGVMDGYKLSEMNTYDCWGDFRGEFWCQCHW
jgi:hypothetical protein